MGARLPKRGRPRYYLSDLDAAGFSCPSDIRQKNRLIAVGCSVSGSCTLGFVALGVATSAGMATFALYLRLHLISCYGSHVSLEQPNTLNAILNAIIYELTDYL